MVTIHHRIARQDLGLGLVAAHGLDAGAAPAALASEIERWIETRRNQPLSAAEENLRQKSRDLLRNGTYKPTGRGKPASEYLLRAAHEGSFPRISGPVDANNLMSIKYCVAISLWDLDLAPSEEVEFRLGTAEESYVFNAAGQVLALGDLVCGAALSADGRSVPMVTPVKDSLATKLRPETTRVGGCLYFPLDCGGPARLSEIAREFLDWLLACGPKAQGGSSVCLPGETARL